MTLFKWDSTTDVTDIFNFFEQAISNNSSKLLIVKSFYLLRMSNDYCFCGIPEKRDPGPLRWDPNVGQVGVLRWTLECGPSVVT